LGLPLDPCTSCHIDLFRRIPHPESGVSGGPENDVVIDADGCIVFAEAKWLSPEGKGQGKLKDKAQIQLRQEFLSRHGQAIYGDRAFVVLGIGPLAESVVGPQESGFGVPVKAITWATLASYPQHPCGDEFARYYAWKLKLSRPRKRTLLPPVDAS
jgi:hypothetical protein